MDMASVKKMLENLPNLKVIHLIRDPRAVAYSRFKNMGSAGGAATKDVVKAATIYCQTVTRDMQERQLLEKEFPHSFMQIIYEDFTANPVQVAKNVYSFINTTLPALVEEHLKIETKDRISTKWHNKLTYIELQTIQKICKELYDLVPTSK
jgi:hypothetical protein